MSILQNKMLSRSKFIEIYPDKLLPPLHAAALRSSMVVAVQRYCRMLDRSLSLRGCGVPLVVAALVAVASSCSSSSSTGTGGDSSGTGGSSVSSSGTAMNSSTTTASSGAGGGNP